METIVEDSFEVVKDSYEGVEKNQVIEDSYEGDESIIQIDSNEDLEDGEVESTKHEDSNAQVPTILFKNKGIAKFDLNKFPIENENYENDERDVVED